MLKLGRTLCHYVGRNLIIGRKTVQKTLKGGHNQKSPIILLPPYVTPQELRIMLRIDYPSCMRACNVKLSNKKYFWEDHLGRQFETVNKSKVCVSFELAAFACKNFNLQPRKVDLEPIWNKKSIQCHGEKIPVVALLGHLNHGKTTLLDRFAGTNIAEYEAGKITQNLRCQTVSFNEKLRNENFYLNNNKDEVNYVGENNNYTVKKQEEENCSRKITFIDTPGQRVFGIMRGRGASLADIAVIFVSVEKGAQNETQEVIFQADKFNIPIVFVLNKIDLDPDNIEIVRRELKLLCYTLFKKKIVKKDYTLNALQAISISALYGHGLYELQEKLLNMISSNDLPVNAVEHLNSLDEKILDKYRTCSRRTDMLVGVNTPPSAVGVVIDILKTGDNGTILTVLVRHGSFQEGNYFVVGTAFGRIKKVYFPDGSFKNLTKGTSITIGMAVQISGVTKKGDASVDDIFIVLPRQRAFRLAEYRRRVEHLCKLQIYGVPLEVPWQADSPLLNKRIQVSEIYENRRVDNSGRRAVEEFGVKKEEKIFLNSKPSDLYLKKKNNNLSYNEKEEEIAEDVEIDENELFLNSNVKHKAGKTNSILVRPGKEVYLKYNAASRYQLQENIEEDGEKDEEIEENGVFHETEILKNENKDKSAMSRGRKGRIHNRSVSGRVKKCIHGKENLKSELSMSGRLEDVLNEQDYEHKEQEYYVEEAGREIGQEGQGEAGEAEEEKDEEEEEQQQDDYVRNNLDKPWVHYGNRELWIEDVEKKNNLIMQRWRSKKVQRDLQKQAQEKMQKEIFLESERKRRAALGEPLLTKEEEDSFMRSDEDEEKDYRENNKLDNKSKSSSHEKQEDELLPPKNYPVIPVILRTSCISVFDVLMDGIEDLQRKNKMRIPIVHGGIGAITPTDIVHAEIENEYSYCPVYAFQVGVQPDAVKHALVNRVVIKRFDVFSDLLRDIEIRCDNVIKLVNHNIAVRSLKRHPTRSGL